MEAAKMQFFFFSHRVHGAQREKNCLVGWGELVNPNEIANLFTKKSLMQKQYLTQ
jgi:hypothetical protein